MQTLNILKETLGERLINLLIQSQVDEIMVNPDGVMFIRYASGTTAVEPGFSEMKTQIIARTIATLNHRDIDPLNPVIDGEIEFIKARFSAVLPPLSRGACFCIRSLHALNLSFEELIACGFLTGKMATVLEDLLKQRLNILICGQTGSGKTSFINSMLCRLSDLEPESRIISIEDTPELKLTSKNHVSLYTSEKTSMSDLVRATLRLSPDRIIIGEVRSVEALDMIDAMATGHSGCLASLHAGTLQQCMERLKLLVLRNANAPRNLDNIIASSVQAIVILSRIPKRHISQIALVKGYSSNNYQFEIIGENKCMNCQ